MSLKLSGILGGNIVSKYSKLTNKEIEIQSNGRKEMAFAVESLGVADIGTLI